jgi:uncharacterized protein involved in exopolysaccharide biosynthesis
MDSRVQADNQDDTLNLLDYVSVIVKRWRMVAGLVLLACVLTGGINLLLSKEYEGTATVLPPTGNESTALQALIGPTSTTSFLGGLLPSSSSTDIFVGIFKSRTMQDDVIKRFDLVKVYGYDAPGWFASKAPLRDTRKKLEKMVAIEVSNEGIIFVTTRAYDPKMAADMANFFVENLDRLNTTTNITDAGRTRLFLEKRVGEALKALKDAEDRLKEYQSRSKAVVMEGQAKVALEAAAVLEGQIVAAEVQLKTLQAYATQQNPDVVRLKESIEEMRRQLKRMEYGRNTGNPKAEPGGAASDFSVPLGSIPSTGLDLVRLIREAKIQETIFTLLTQQLEQAKIAEAKDTPTVRLLDRAVVPEVESRPNIPLNVALVGIVSIFVGIFLAFFLEYLTGIRRREGLKAGS